MKNNRMSFKERLLSKRGSVLFIVLVIMSFMVILASVVYYAVQNGRQNIVMDTKQMSLFQNTNLSHVFNCFGVIYVDSELDKTVQSIKNKFPGISVTRTVDMDNRIPKITYTIQDDERKPARNIKSADKVQMAADAYSRTIRNCIIDIKNKRALGKHYGV